LAPDEKISESPGILVIVSAWRTVNLGSNTARYLEVGKSKLCCVFYVTWFDCEWPYKGDNEGLGTNKYFLQNHHKNWPLLPFRVQSYSLTLSISTNFLPKIGDFPKKMLWWIFSA
jgi:hypothetical protein